jgi:protein-tyrosine phosphatase
VLRELAARDSPQLISAVDSAGTAAYHVGDPPDPRTVKSARQRGYDLSGLRARQVSQRDFIEFDLILAMDRANLAALRAMAPAASHDRLGLFLRYAAQPGIAEVPDPYHGTQSDFERVVDLIEQGSHALLAHLRGQRMAAGDQ